MDWITHKVYMSIDSSNGQKSGRIEACQIDWWLKGQGLMNQHQCVIVMHRSLDSLYGLVVDPMDGYMYWLNRVHKRIERAWMNGLHLDRHPFHEQIPEQQIATISALTLHPSNRLLFYSRRLFDAESSEIVACILHNRGSCRTIKNGIQATYLAVFQVGFKNNEVFANNNWFLEVYFLVYN